MLQPDVHEWLRRRTYPLTEVDAAELRAHKDRTGVSIAVALPALNEQDTIGSICRTIRAHLMQEIELVDRLVVVDSGSTDDTLTIASSAGAEVFRAADLRPRVVSGGKGEVLWKSVLVCPEDILVWVDSDIKNFTVDFVTRLLAPLLTEPDIHLVKAYFDRPLLRPDGSVEEGARVTELLARPLLNLLAPELAGVIQPLGGECAGRRRALATLPFFTGYAVDVCLMLDFVGGFGLDALAQVDLGTRVHRNQDIPALGRMAHQIARALLQRLDDDGRIKLTERLPETLVQFAEGPDAPEVRSARSPSIELPPVESLPRLP